MAKIIVYTMAFNAEKTLRRCADSVLNQTHGDIRYYLCDHGSTDGTRNIVLDYANKDNRVTPILLGDNYFTTGNGVNPFIDFTATTLIGEYDKGTADYFCLLDADDEYRPEFLAKMLAFMENNGLSVAACGTDAYGAGDGTFIGTRALAENLILEGSAFGESFPAYFPFLRAVWGKVFRISLLKECEFSSYNSYHEIGYGADTLFCMRAFLLAERAGVLNDVLHNYFQGSQSASFTWHRGRVDDGSVLLGEIEEYLVSKVGTVSAENKEILLKIYYNTIMEAFNLLKNAQQTQDVV